MPAVALKTATICVPETFCNSTSFEGHIAEARLKENKWHSHARPTRLMEKDNLDQTDAVAWSAYHASTHSSVVDTHVTLTQLLPIFYEKAATAAMIKHGMNMLRQATQLLNPDQTPIIALDAPLYALAKFTQWKWPQTHGESQFVILSGGLHIEMAVWNTYGDYLEGSGWTSVLTQAGITSSGTADSFLKAAHLTRTRHAHQISVLSLANLQNDPFLKCDVLHNDTTKEIWQKNMIKKSPTFQYWDTVLNMEIIGLIFVRAHRD